MWRSKPFLHACSMRSTGTFTTTPPARTITRSPPVVPIQRHGIADSAISASNSRCRSEEHTSELKSRRDLVCRLLLEKKNQGNILLLGKISNLHNRRNTSISLFLLVQFHFSELFLLRQSGVNHASKRIIFFFNDTATTEIYTLSLHDALPISRAAVPLPLRPFRRRDRNHRCS